MPTTQSLINTVRTSYRNSYDDVQLIEWMDITQKQIFQTVRHEAVPYSFPTVSGYAFYPLPDDCDPMGVKQIDIETKAGSNLFSQLKFINIESNQQVGEQDEFYSISSNEDIYINPLPDDNTAGRTVYVYYNKKPADLSTSDLNQTPDLEENFHELLILGCLERVARARGELQDKQMFASDFEELFKRYKKQYAQPFPEYKTPTDNLPRRRGQVYTKGPSSYPYQFLPTQYL